MNINPVHKKLLIAAYEQYRAAQANLNFVRNIVSNEYGLTQQDTLNIYSDVSVNSSSNMKQKVEDLFEENAESD